MARPDSPSRRDVLRCTAALVATLVAGSVSLAASAHSPPPARLAQIEVRDRTTGTPLPVHEQEGRMYIVGQPGHEYAIRIRNLTGARILAVASVDGVNVISGDTASFDQSGYVIDPWGSVEIAGWRKSLSRTAAFFFTEHANSYAARTGRPFDVGVIGVAVFAERLRPPMRISEPRMHGDARRESRPQAEPVPPLAQAPAPSSAPSSGAAAEAQRDDASTRDRAANAQPMAKLGTGHGRSETSHARQVAFERSTPDPLQVVVYQYDRFENLVALGVLPATPPHYARRAPQPFPGLRFAPDPR